MRDEADAARRLDLLAVVVVAVLDYGGRPVLVADLLRRRELLDRLVQVLVVRPVVPGERELVWSLKDEVVGEPERETNFFSTLAMVKAKLESSLSETLWLLCL